MRNIFIVRHAESIANAGEKTEAHDTIPLSEKGKIQAEELVKELLIIPELIVVSPFTRTYETALPFIRKHQSIPVETWNVEEFTYLDPKIYNGTTREERFSAVKKYWDTSDIYYQDTHEVESFHSFITRIEHFLHKLKNRSEKNIVIFSHGGFIQNVKTYLDVVGGLHEEGISHNDVLELMIRYKGIIGEKFPIENASVHRLTF